MRHFSVILTGAQYEVTIKAPGAYGNGQSAYILEGEPDGFPEEVARITVALPLPPAEGCIWVKDWSENEGLARQLVAEGLIELTGRFQPSGFVNALEARPIGEFAAGIADGSLR